MALPRIRRGQVLKGIPARGWNAAMTAAEKVNRTDLDALTAKFNAHAETAQIVSVRNSSGADLPRFGVLVINGPILTPTENADAFKSTLTIDGVAAGGYSGQFVIAIEPIADGAIGRAVISGVTVAIINVQGAHDAYVDTDNASDVLVTRASGAARVLWRETGTGEKLAIINITGERSDFAIPCTVKQVGGSAGGKSAAATFTYEVKDIRGHFLADSDTTPISPTKPRPEIGKMAAPEDDSVGIGYFDHTGDFHLWDAGEQPEKAACD